MTEKVFNIEEIYKNPVLKSLKDYAKIKTAFHETADKESQLLNEKSEEISKLIQTGIFDDSSIVPKYRGVIDYYKRIINAFTNFGKASDEIINEIKGIVDKYYISKKDHVKEIKELKKEHLKEIKESKKDHLKEIKESKKEQKDVKKLKQSKPEIEKQI